MGIWKWDRLPSSQWPEGQHAWRMMDKCRVAPDGFREMSRGQLCGTLQTTVRSFILGGEIRKEISFKGVTYPVERYHSGFCVVRARSEATNLERAGTALAGMKD